MSLELTRRGLLSLIPAALLAPKAITQLKAAATPIPPSVPARLQRFMFGMTGLGRSPSIHPERRCRIRNVSAHGENAELVKFKVLRNGEPMIGDVIEREDAISVYLYEISYIHPCPISIVLTIA